MRAFALLGFATLFALPDVAHACGGCFHRETTGPSAYDAGVPTPTGTTMGAGDRQVVTDHRMVLSVSADATTLWDQIRYSGNPDEFIWVLPVADGHQIDIGLADNAFVDTLDRLSSPIIQSPSITCFSDGTSMVTTGTSRGSSSGGCGGSTFSYESTDTGVGGGGGDSHTLRGADESMIGQMGGAIVGPYAVEILGTNMGSVGLDTWLTSNHFAIPVAVRPAVEFYSQRHFDFIVLHLRPGFGVQQMQPVRITVHGSASVLPLRMIAAGVADSVSLTLMILARDSMRAQNFQNDIIQASDLIYDFRAQRSNYRELFNAAVQAGGGQTWITESVQGLASGVMDYAPDAGTPNLEDGGLGGFPGTDAGVFAMDGAVRPAMDAGSSPPVSVDPLVDRRIAYAGLHGYAKLTRMRAVMYARNLDRDLILETGELAELGPQRFAARAADPPACPVTMRTPSVPVDAGTRDAGTASSRGYVSCRATRAKVSSRGALWIVTAAGIALYVRRRRR